MNRRTTSFWRDVRPMLQRAANHQWVSNDSTWPLVSTDWHALADATPEAAALRAENAMLVRSAETLLHDVTLREIVQDGTGEWIERSTVLQLQENTK